MFLFNKCPLKPAGNEGGEQGLREACYQSDSHLSFLHILCASDLQSFLKRTQPQLLSLSIPTFISISLSCLIETVLRFTHTEPFIKNASYKKAQSNYWTLAVPRPHPLDFICEKTKFPKVQLWFIYLWKILFSKPNGAPLLNYGCKRAELVNKW